MESYEPRAFRFIELLAIGDWRMKLYGIAWRDERPRREPLETARRITHEQLAQEKPNDYRVGFIGAHDGREPVSCLSIFGETRMSFFIASSFRVLTIRSN
jgi:hypothetical protein